MVCRTVRATIPDALPPTEADVVRAASTRPVPPDEPDRTSPSRDCTRTQSRTGARRHRGSCPRQYQGPDPVSAGGALVRAATIRAVTDAPGDPLASSIRARARAAVGRAWDAAVADGALPPSRRTLRPRRSRSSGRRTRTTATSRRTSPCSWPGRSGWPRSRSRRHSPPRSSAARRPTRRGDHRRRDRGRAGLRQPPPRRRGARGDRGGGSSPSPPLGPALGRDRRAAVNVEFVSANPTGPLHVGNARGAFVGDLLCRVLEAGGQQVTREYYFNDSGGQVRNLGASVPRAAAGRPGPGGRLQRRLRRRPRGELPDDVLGRRHRRPAPTPTGSSGAGRPTASARASRRA